MAPVPKAPSKKEIGERKGTGYFFSEMKLWQIGLLIFVVAGAINALFINLSIGGLPREPARLSILTGLIVLGFGLVKRKK